MHASVTVSGQTAAGYFTSRPTSKGFIREGTAFLQAARQLELLAPAPDPDPETQAGNPVQPGMPAGVGGAAAGRGERAPRPGTDALEAAISLLQHHDSITGTEKQHVANDYHRRLARGVCAWYQEYERGSGLGVWLDSMRTTQAANYARQLHARADLTDMDIITCAVEA